MIPKLTINEGKIDEIWKEKEFSDYVKEALNPILLNDGTEVYMYYADFIDFGVFNEFNSLKPISEFYNYGYCDTEDALIRYLEQYKKDSENYIVFLSFMSMDYEKYYKNGTYINKDGTDTREDYYYYIDEHPEMKVPQEIENKWICFTIRKLNKK